MTIFRRATLLSGLCKLARMWARALTVLLFWVRGGGVRRFEFRRRAFIAGFRKCSFHTVLV